MNRAGLRTGPFTNGKMRNAGGSRISLSACDHDCVSNVVDRVLHRRDVLGIAVRYQDVEFVLQSHDDFDGIELIGAEVIPEVGCGNDLRSMQQ